MKVGIMQPYFFPYIGYFQLIKLVDKFIIYDDVNYIKRGWINRNRILINDEPAYLTVPLRKVSQNKLICETYLNEEDKEFEKIKRSIELAYKSTPYFKDVFPVLEETLIFRENVAEFNYSLLKKVSEYLKIETEFVESSTKYENSTLKGQERILDICQKENANHYINPIGGMELYNKDTFEQTGVKLNFIQAELQPYQQFNNDFVPGLSIIDVMMFNSVSEISEMLESYKLC
jgi:hypothetical protein